LIFGGVNFRITTGTSDGWPKVDQTIINIAAGVVAAFLSPFLAPGPATPAEPPLLWAVLAWVRREVQRTFFNRSPVAIDNAYTTSEDSGLSGNVLTDGVDDTDADGDPLTATVVTGPQHGTLVLNPNGSFTYTPTANYSGTDTFTYKVSASDSFSYYATDGNTVTVFITVNPF
jgi:VCBS repeat-containing protein